MVPQDPWTIEDTAITRSDLDLFDHHSVSRQLSRIIRGSKESLAVGLLGPFGSGKSSVVRMLATELANNDQWAVLHVSAEHHSGVARARGLMYALLDDAHRQKLIKDDAFESDRNRLEGSHQHTLPRRSKSSAQTGSSGRKYFFAALTGLVWVAAMLVVVWGLGMGATALLHLLGAARTVPSLTWFAADGATPLTGVFVVGAVVAGVLSAGKEGAVQTLKAYEITVTSPRPEATDELERAFIRLLEKISRRVVIAVDDIDRLGASEVLDALATLRSLLLTGAHHRHKPVFLLSCDEDIVREAIVGVRPGLAHRPVVPSESAHAGTEVRTTRKATEEAAQEYLNKLFTVRIVLPAHHDADLRTYAEEILLHGPRQHPAVSALGGPAVMRTLLEVLVHRDVRDPRHVIRLLNSFFTDYDLARHREASEGSGRPPRIALGEVTGYPVELARLTVLRHDFRTLYDRIYAEHGLLHLLDDALLGDEKALADPLLETFRIKDADPLRLDLKKVGLAYLNATVRRAKTQRPARIGALLSLGSTQASRLLGSEMATAIESELVQRDSAAFAARLGEAPNRTRVLEAATAAIDAARPGQDRDNALAAAVEGLAQVPELESVAAQDEDYQAVRALTDRIARLWDEMSLPVPSYALAPLLDLTDAAHLNRLLGTLKKIPTDEEEARTWATTLLTLPSGSHATALRPDVVRYFNHLAEAGSKQNLEFWTTRRHVPTDALPTEVFSSLMVLAARYGDGTALRRAGQLTIDGADTHGWGRKIIKALLFCLSNSDEVQLETVEILCHTAPKDDWGPSPDGSPHTLASDIAVAVSAFLAEDEGDSALTTARLLRDWLPGIVQLRDADRALRAVGEAVTAVAGDDEELAAVAGGILTGLPQEHAASLAMALAHTLDSHRDLDDPVGASLRDGLLHYLHALPEDAASEVQQAASLCATTLTTEVEALTPGGRFARRTLPMLLTTATGRDGASGVAERLIVGIQNQIGQETQELLESLQLVFRDQMVRSQYLPRALQVMHALISYNRIEPALSFLAHYIDDPAVDSAWPPMFASHWAALPQSTRSRATAAAERADIAGTGLPNLLLEHLLSTEDTAPWQYATSLWKHLGSEEQSRLVADARGRAPGLAQYLKTADSDLLCAALVKSSGDHLPQTLQLMHGSPQAGSAMTSFIDHCLAQPDWQPDRIAVIVAACPEPEALWSHVLPIMAEDQGTAAKVAHIIGSLIESHPASIPTALLQYLHPILKVADPALATELGKALRSQKKLAEKLRRSLTGFGSTPEQRARNKAFKDASGI
ncbi:P-loop NTPase fold protein [Streptomyces sp. NPDC059718]